MTKNDKAILVTGASSSFGHCTTEVLATNGHFVDACAGEQTDIDALNAIKNATGNR